MDHSKMDHSMPGHDMPDMDMCSMNMIFTWDWKNTCVIFEWWHIKSFSSFLFSLFCIVGLAAFYEFLRARSKRLDAKIQSVRLEDNEEPLTKSSSETISRLQKAVFYGVLVGYSYLLMLIFMTYNGWIMLAIAVGAGIGNYVFGTEFSETLACH